MSGWFCNQEGGDIVEMKFNLRSIPLLGAIAMLSLVGLVGAVNPPAPMQTQTIQELNGQIFKVTGAFSLIVTGFHGAGLDQPATGPCSWTSTNLNGINPPLCTTALTSGDWIYEIIMKLNTVPAVDTPYTMLVHLNGFSNALYFDVPATATVGSVTTFDIDAGTALWTAPMVFVIEVY